jgi:hypothetical protein
MKGAMEYNRLLSRRVVTQDARSYTSLSDVSMVWCLVKQRRKFSVTFAEDVGIFRDNFLVKMYCAVITLFWID